MTGQPQRTYIWNGLYSTWDEACKAAKNYNEGGVFSSERWLKRITQQLLDYRNEFRQYGIALPPRSSNFPLVCAMTSPGTIVDFGGSSGWGWDYLQNSLPRHGISSYVIVEMESVAKYMKDSGLHSDPINYQTLEDPLDRCDLLYCNSVLQYFESNAPLLSLVGRTTPDFIFLEDVIAKSEEDFFTTQSYYNSVIPYRFIGLGKLLKDLSYLGYHELVRFPYASPILGVMKPLEMENFPQRNRLRYSSSILLSKSEGQ